MIDFTSITSHLDPVTLAKTSRLNQLQEEKIAKSASEFEALLMGIIFQGLRKTVEPSGLLGTNQNERSTYEYLLDQAILQQAVAGGHTWGLAARLEESWKMLQLKAINDEGVSE